MFGRVLGEPLTLTTESLQKYLKFRNIFSDWERRPIKIWLEKQEQFRPKSGFLVLIKKTVCLCQCITYFIVEALRTASCNNTDSNFRGILRIVCMSCDEPKNYWRPKSPTLLWIAKLKNPLKPLIKRRKVLFLVLIKLISLTDLLTLIKFCAMHFLILDLLYNKILSQLATPIVVCNTAQKMKFSVNDFFSKCDQIRRKYL